jgi:hypothetical protein
MPKRLLDDRRVWRTATVTLAVLLVALAAAARSTAPSAQARAAKAVESAATESGTRGAPPSLPKVVRTGRYRLYLSFSPNHAQALEKVTVRLVRGRRPAPRRIKLTTTMPSMDGMGYTGFLTQKRPGEFEHLWPPLEMTGTWHFRYDVSPQHAPRFAVTVPLRLRP